MKKLTNEWWLTFEEVQLLELEICEEKEENEEDSIFKIPSNNRTSLVHALASQNMISFDNYGISNTWA